MSGPLLDINTAILETSLSTRSLQSRRKDKTLETYLKQQAKHKVS